MLSRVVFLGPQRHVKTVAGAAASLAPGDGPLALVSAGWEERETEDQEFRDHVQRPVHNLEVFSRVERIFERDPELLQAMRQRHETLRRLQDLYRLRLSGLMDACQQLLRTVDEPALMEPERQGALAMLQRLDQEHVRRMARLHAEFEARFRPGERPAVQEERAQLRELLQQCACLCIAGGHVSVLLHRLRLFDLLALRPDLPVVAWSAGAMVLCPRIVLFHDDPPQGAAHAEVMEAGLHATAGIVALPHGSRRLRLQDGYNVQLTASRFAPDFCAVLDPGTRLDWNGLRWSAPAGTQRLGENGRLLEIGA